MAGGNATDEDKRSLLDRIEESGDVTTVNTSDLLDLLEADLSKDIDSTGVPQPGSKGGTPRGSRRSSLETGGYGSGGGRSKARTGRREEYDLAGSFTSRHSFTSKLLGGDENDDDEEGGEISFDSYDGSSPAKSAGGGNPTSDAEASVKAADHSADAGANSASDTSNSLRYGRRISSAASLTSIGGGSSVGSAARSHFDNPFRSGRTAGGKVGGGGGSRGYHNGHGQLDVRGVRERGGRGGGEGDATCSDSSYGADRSGTDDSFGRSGGGRGRTLRPPRSSGQSVTFSEDTSRVSSRRRSLSPAERNHGEDGANHGLDTFSLGSLGSLAVSASSRSAGHASQASRTTRSSRSSRSSHGSATTASTHSSRDSEERRRRRELVPVPVKRRRGGSRTGSSVGSAR